MLSLNNVSCINNERELFAPVSFELGASEHVYIRGLNGTGKTTLLKTLALLRPVDTGTISWCQTDLNYIERSVYLREIHYISHEYFFHKGLSVKDNIDFCLSLYDTLRDSSEISEMLERYGISSFKNTIFSKLSAGTKQKLSLVVMGLKGAIKLLLLDEPWKNLDLKGKNELEFQIDMHLKNGGSIIETSHDIKAHSRNVCLTPREEVWS